MKLTVNVNKKGENLGDLFGIFFEDLNHAADGGLYAEMVRNRAFEFAPIDHPDYDHLTAWQKIENHGAAKLVIETGNPVSQNNPHYLGLDILVQGKDVGILNLGYNEGFALKEGERYCFSCYAKREQNQESPLRVSFRDKEGSVYTQQEFLITDSWMKYELELTATMTDSAGRLAITAEGQGKIYLDFVSLFPKDTFKGRKNGMRRDIAEKLEELRPRFMRFPGGCLVHCGSLDEDARDSQYRWKKTLGDIENRPARRNNWNGNQTLGIGFYEYFQFCEDIHTKPLPVLPAGYDPHAQRAVPMDKLKPWIDDALDLIEFANGGTDTQWGKKRAQLGHPDPFHMEYIGIGNEEVGEAFFERYKVICKAIKEKYPEIKVIGTSGPNAAGGEFDRGWNCARETETDIVDEHYYQSPEWFLAHHYRYDSYDRQAPKVFLGEYASWGNTWYNALTEATYMLGLERNAGVVAMSCYAPMLCNVDYVNWKPDLIWFNNHQVYGTANYYVQKLFMNHQGDRLLEIKAEEAPDFCIPTKTPIRGKILLAGYESSVEYSQISITDEDSKRVFLFEDCIVKSGEKQELAMMECENYTLKLRAKETGGWKGFQIFFGVEEGNQLWWIIGGWQNQDTFIGERINGRNSDLSQYLFTVENNREYNLELRIRGRKIETWVDGVRLHHIESKEICMEPLYYSASIENDTGDVILKAVNMKAKPQEADIHVEGSGQIRVCQVYQMQGWGRDAENDFTHPELISPKTTELLVEGNTFRFVFPGESFTIIRMET